MTSAIRNIGAIVLSIFLPIISFFGKNRVGVAVPESFSLNVLSPPVQRLQQYLRIRTDHASPAYFEAVDFLNLTTSTLLPTAAFATHEFVPGKPVAIVTLPGSDASLPSLMLNSHTDVVPAEPDKWTWDPFAAKLIFAQREWRIYARGSQDMKSVGLQYLEALAALVEQGWKPQRTVHVTFVPDEEVGGRDGMGKLVESKVFRKMNVGVALDEGLPNAKGTFNIYYGERQTWWLAVKVVGSPGHGATFPEHSAAQILHGIIGRVLAFRRNEFVKLNSTDGDLGDAISVNLSFLKAGQPDESQPSGYIMNMVPSVAEAGFDIRVPPLVNPDELDKVIESWVTCDDGKTCPGTTYQWVIKVKNPFVTSRVPAENPHIVSFSRGLSDAGISDRLRHGIFFAATDARYLREVKVPSFGFSPIEKTPNLLHKHNEYITMDGYLKGCKVYEDIIKQMAGPEPKPEKQLEVLSSGGSDPADHREL